MKNSNVLICNDCKSFWIAPMSKCDCGSTVLSKTHPSNVDKALNKVTKIETNLIKNPITNEILCECEIGYYMVLFSVYQTFPNEHNITMVNDDIYSELIEDEIIDINTGITLDTSNWVMKKLTISFPDYL